MLKLINYFITSIIIFEFLSFILGYGTHFEHYKYATMLTIISVNFVFLKNQSKLNQVKQVHNRNKGV